MSNWSIGDIDEDLRAYLVEDEGGSAPQLQASTSEDLANLFAEHNVQRSSSESANENLATLFIEHRVDEPIKKKERNPRKLSPITDEKAAVLVQLMELFPQFDEKTVKTCLQTNNYDFERTLDELANASTVGTQFLSDIPDGPVAPQSVFAPINDVMKAATRFSSMSVGASTSRKRDLEQDANKNTQQNVRNGVADAHQKKATHYRGLAAKAKPTEQMAYLTLAREEDKMALMAQQEEDAATAKTITSRLDLHGYDIKRALNVLQLSIEYLRKRRPLQKRLEIVTGWGANNPQNRSVLKPAVVKWLQQYDIKLTVPDFNPGALIIDLFSVQKWCLMELDKAPYRVILYFFDDLRLVFNRSLDHLEPWQVVLYTLSMTLLIQWVRKVIRIDDSSSISRSWHNLLLNFPFYRERIDELKEASLKELEEKLLRSDIRREFYKFLPEKGLSSEDIIAEAIAYKGMGGDSTERGRLSGNLFVDDNDDQKQIMLKIFELYSHTNANFPDIFPACRKMEAEIIRMLCSLYHGGARACGTVTTSGTESIILCCMAYRKIAVRRGIRKPEIIIGKNADVSFRKAAKLIGLRLVTVPVDDFTGQMDLSAMKRAISPETCMIAASAPNYVTGVMDEIEKISELALRFGVPVHVDASIGGFLLPFMEQCDYPSPMFDFRLSGVTSISVDLHKYAYCPMGSSAVLYREQYLLQAQCFSDVNWPGGIYVTPTLSGSRPGSLLALTWATLLCNGRLGFVEKTQRVLDAVQTLKEKLDTSPFVEVIGNPVLSSVAFRSKNPKVNIYVLGDLMNELGWNLAFVQKPEALRISVSPANANSELIGEFCDDLRRSCERIEAKTDSTPIPKMAVFHGISSSFIDHGIVEDLPSMFVEAYYSTPLVPKRSARTLSIEGRKLSTLQIPGSTNLSALQEHYEGRKFSATLSPHQE